MSSGSKGQRHLSGALSVAMLVATLSAAGPTQAAAPPSTAIPATEVAPTATPGTTAARLPDHVVAQWRVTNPSFIAFAFGSVWVTDHYGHTITRIDPASNTVAAVIKGTGNNPEDALEVGDALWVTGQNDDMVLIDPTTNTVIRTIKGDHLFMDQGFGSVWVTTRDNKVDRFDPATAEVTASITVGDGEDACMNDTVVAGPAVWVISCDKAELIRIDPVTNSVMSRTGWATLVNEAQAQKPPAKGTDSVWFDVGGGDVPTGLLRVDAVTGTGLTFLPLTPAQVPNGFIAVTDEAVWMGGTRQIDRVDIATNQIDRTYPTGPGLLKVGVAFGSVWLRNFEQNLIQRLDVQP